MHGLQRLVWNETAALVLLMILLAGCGGPKTSDRNLVFIGVEDAEVLVRGRTDIFGNRSSAALVDPRSSYDFSQGHIPGAIHVPYEDVEEGMDRLRRYDVVIVYGDDYNSAIARAMSKTLIEKGLKDVRTLEGGMRAWTDADRELETGSGR